MYHFCHYVHHFLHSCHKKTAGLAGLSLMTMRGEGMGGLTNAARAEAAF